MPDVDYQIKRSRVRRLQSFEMRQLGISDSVVSAENCVMYVSPVYTEPDSGPVSVKVYDITNGTLLWDEVLWFPYVDSQNTKVYGLYPSGTKVYNAGINSSFALSFSGSTAVLASGGSQEIALPVVKSYNISDGTLASTSPIYTGAFWGGEGYG